MSKLKWEKDPTQLTLMEAAEVLGVDAGLLHYLAYRGTQMELVRKPRVVVSSEYGQRIEYFLCDLEVVVQADAEYRLTGGIPKDPDPTEEW